MSSTDIDLNVIISAASLLIAAIAYVGSARGQRKVFQRFTEMVIQQKELIRLQSEVLVDMALPYFMGETEYFESDKNKDIRIKLTSPNTAKEFSASMVEGNKWKIINILNNIAHPNVPITIDIQYIGNDREKFTSKQIHLQYFQTVIRFKDKRSKSYMQIITHFVKNIEMSIPLPPSTDYHYNTEKLSWRKRIILKVQSIFNINKVN